MPFLSPWAVKPPTSHRCIRKVIQPKLFLRIKKYPFTSGDARMLEWQSEQCKRCLLLVYMAFLNKRNQRSQQSWNQCCMMMSAEILIYPVQRNDPAATCNAHQHLNSPPIATTHHVGRAVDDRVTDDKISEFRNCRMHCGLLSEHAHKTVWLTGV